MNETRVTLGIEADSCDRLPELILCCLVSFSTATAIILDGTIKIVSVRRPSLWHFIKRLKDEEARIRRTVRHIRTGMLQPSRRSRWRRLDDKIERLKEQYNQGVISMKAYWNAIRYAVSSHQGRVLAGLIAVEV